MVDKVDLLVEVWKKAFYAGLELELQTSLVQFYAGWYDELEKREKALIDLEGEVGYSLTKALNDYYKLKKKHHEIEDILAELYQKSERQPDPAVAGGDCNSADVPAAPQVPNEFDNSPFL